MVQGKINRGKQTDHPAGRHSIWINQCPLPSTIPHFLYRLDALPATQPTVSKHWRQLVQINVKIMVLLLCFLPVKLERGIKWLTAMRLCLSCAHSSKTAFCSYGYYETLTWNYVLEVKPTSQSTWSPEVDLVSDVAVFVLKRGVKLQPTTSGPNVLQAVKTCCQYFEKPRESFRVG